MEKQPTQTDYEHVQLILEEANKYGLKWEVEKASIDKLEADPTLSLVEAYTHGYKEWIK